jgi:uncharacterized membrane protein YphA (DoxX/SURF4 family)
MPENEINNTETKGRMMDTTHPIAKTTDHKLVIIPRILAGLPLVGFGVLHFLKPEGFQNILVASGIPLVSLNMVIAPAAEVLAGVLLLLGLYARVGGALGITTMLVAIYSTVVLSSTTIETLPAGMMAVPHVPPLPLPVMIIVVSLVVVVLGGGTWSLDLKNQSESNSA